eukprot:FR739443.1.p1 GENE.FR739443.1~~FR739443.1.p1  ORF type:complete len:279 (+),score=19.23 FR739443.1:123-839(+)
MRRTSSLSDLKVNGDRGNWSEVVDECTGQFYYWNTFTGQSQWEPPSEFLHACRMEAELALSATGFKATTSIDNHSDDGTTSSEGSIDSNCNNKRFRDVAGDPDHGPGFPKRKCTAEAGGHHPDSASLDFYYSEADADTTWEQLQVSTEALGGLQKALYERRTSPALVALVTFGLRTTPFQRPSNLLSAVKEKLNSNPGLCNELRRYREALEPNNLCGSQCSDRAGAYADGPVEACTEE